MTMNTLIAAAVLAIAPFAAAAATINPGDSVVENNKLDPNGSIQYEFTAGADLKVLDFVSVNSVGFNDGEDLAQVMFGYTSTDVAGVSTMYTAFDVDGATTKANASIGGFTLKAGETFTFFFDYGQGSDTVSNQFNFKTASLSTVPLPAGGLMLLTALGGLGVARRRKAAAAA